MNFEYPLYDMTFEEYTDRLEHLALELEAPETVVRRSQELLLKCERNATELGTLSPPVLTAAVFYIASVETDSPCIQREIASIMDVSQSGVRNNYRKLIEVLELDNDNLVQRMKRYEHGGDPNAFETYRVRDNAGTSSDDNDT